MPERRRMSVVDVQERRVDAREEMIITGRSCHKYNFFRNKTCCEKHVFVTTKHIFCHDKSMLVTTQLLSQQTSFLLQQNVCHNKHTFVATKDVFCHDKQVFVMTKHLS